jgi:hypothetical protein
MKITSGILSAAPLTLALMLGTPSAQACNGGGNCSSAPATQRERLGRLLVPAFRFSRSATASIGWLSVVARQTDIYYTESLD